MAAGLALPPPRRVLRTGHERCAGDSPVHEAARMSVASHFTVTGERGFPVADLGGGSRIAGSGNERPSPRVVPGFDGLTLGGAFCWSHRAAEPRQNLHSLRERHWLVSTWASIAFRRAEWMWHTATAKASAASSGWGTKSSASSTLTNCCI